MWAEHLVARTSFVLSLSKLLALVKASPKNLRKLEKLLSQVASSTKSGFVPALTFSERGEDILLADLEQASGFYVDVGAHHPFRFSTTARLANAGWRGVCFDVTPAVPSDFELYREGSLAFRSLIGFRGEVKFFRFEEQLLSTTDEKSISALKALGFGSPTEEVLSRLPLHEALIAAGIKPQVINFLSVDVEGADEDVLKSHNFELFPVEVLMVELSPVGQEGTVFEPMPAEQIESAIRLLEPIGFRLSRFIHRSALFVKKDLVTEVLGGART